VDLIKSIKGSYSIPPPSKEGLEVVMDYTTARLLISAGLPIGRKVLTNPNLHPAIFKDKDLAKYYVLVTFLEEGSSYLSLSRHGTLTLGLSMGRNVDVTEILPSYIREELVRRYRGKSLSISELPHPLLCEIFTNPMLAPNALIQDYVLVRSFLKKFDERLSIGDINCSYIHVSKKGRVTVSYRFNIKSEESVRAFYEIFIRDANTGAWKEEKLKAQLSLLEEYSGRRISREQWLAIKEEMNKWQRIPLEWIVEKARRLLPEITWLDDPSCLRRLI